MAEARRVLERGGEPPDFAADGARYWLVSAARRSSWRRGARRRRSRRPSASRATTPTWSTLPSIRGAGSWPRRTTGSGTASRRSRWQPRRSSSHAAGARPASSATLRVSGRSSARTASTICARPSTCSRLAWRLEHAKALAALGSALRRARRPTEAREPLCLALELADACGAAGLAEDVRTELYATGARPRTTAASGVGSLTAGELRVVSLAAEGQTNRDIAQALFVTPKTVEVHLTNAYRKLGISSRRELAGALSRKL